MKTIMKGSFKKGELRRVPNHIAKLYVEVDETHRYVPKHCWQRVGRKDVEFVNNKYYPL
jgi:hypothetical protein